MKRIWRTLVVCLLVSAFVMLPVIGMAADFELFWNPNCNADADLEGYYIYYKEDTSVVDDPSGAIDVYVSLTDIDFDPDNPSHLIPGLRDDVRYCFAIAAWYGDQESGMSNEACGINGSYVSDPDPDPGGPQISKTNWHLVYVDSEELAAEDGAAINAFDGDPDTIWHTQLSASPDPIHPHEIIIDLGDTYDLNGFIYESYQVNGRIIDYDFFVGTNSSGPWMIPVRSGVFANDATIKTVSFPEITGRYIRLVAYSEPNGNIWTTAAEIGVTGSPSAPPNEIPVANAGGPYETTDTDDSGSEAVALDGSASWDSDGTITSYQWFEDGTLLGTGVNPTLSFTVGAHTVSLTVTDNNNAAHSNATTVTVNNKPTNTPPNGVIDSPVGNQTIYVGESIFFSGVGSDPDGDTPLSCRWEFGAGSGIADYTTDDDPGEIFFDNAGTFSVTFTVTDSEGATDPTPDTRVITVVEKSSSGPIAKAEWQLVYVDSEELVALDGAATNAFDGNSRTMWHTEWDGSADPAHPHEIIIDLGHTYDLDGFSYEPYKRRGRIVDYEFFVGTGGNGSWTSVASGAFPNGASAKSSSFPVTTGRYIRLVAYSEAKGGPWTSAVEIGVTGIPRLP